MAQMTLLDDLPFQRIPRHIAIIMDGNGRWAVARGLPRVEGHQQGAKVVRGLVTECSRLRREYGAPDFLTLYSFSLENWKRPASEVTYLMQMYVDYLRQEQPTMMENNIRFKQIGRLENLPDLVNDQVNQTLAETANNDGLQLNLALNYGSRGDHGCRPCHRRQSRGRKIDPRDIREQTISDHLYTAGMPDPDLLIRTAGEMRVSNYLLWQISYAELVVSPVLWPDFNIEEFHKTLAEFASRNRRFGALDHTNTLPAESR